MGKSKLSKAELVFHGTKNYLVLIQGQAREYGLSSLEMSASLKGPTLNLSDSKGAEYFEELLLVYENIGYLGLFAVGFMSSRL